MGFWPIRAWKGPIYVINLNKLHFSSTSSLVFLWGEKVDGGKGESPIGDQFLISGCQHLIFGRIGNQWVAISSPIRLAVLHIISPKYISIA